MYVARPEIFKISGKGVDDRYFTQTLLPDYINDHRDECASWDICWDDRGPFVEPHTDRRIGSGRSPSGNMSATTPTRFSKRQGSHVRRSKPTAPKGRYGGLIYIEKEGFWPIFERARLAEKFDVSIMSCKGMSVTAARTLIDKRCATISRCSSCMSAASPLLRLSSPTPGGFPSSQNSGPSILASA
jgi:hypothetical protein